MCARVCARVCVCVCVYISVNHGPVSVSCTVGTHSATEPSLPWPLAAGDPRQLSPPPETEASVCVCIRRIFCTGMDEHIQATSV